MAPTGGPGVPVLVITGATTTGKTALSLEVAQRLAGEIISMDSRQVYRGMDVGTDKVSLRDRARVPHHGLDLVDPDERYGAGRFARDARRWIRAVRNRGRVPILAGGTGFYLRALTTPLFEEPPLDPARRSALEHVLSHWSVEQLHAAARVLDAPRAGLAREGGRQRLMRTLEVALLTGRPLSWWHRQPQPAPHPPIAPVVVVLQKDREALDRAIEDRVDRMLANGLPEEVGRLLEAGYCPHAPGMTGTGYREMAQVLRGRCDLGTARESMVRQTRQYARRQMTWVRTQVKGAHELDGARSRTELVTNVMEIWEGRGG